MKSFSIQEINSVLQGTIVGNTTSTITGPEQLEMASNSQISFIGHKKYLKFWESSKGSNH